MTGTTAAPYPVGLPADVTVGLLRTETDAHRVVDLLIRVWGHPGGERPMPPELLLALAHSGNYVAMACDGDEVVGASVAFRGLDADGPLLHSHMTGVLPRVRGASVGLALKCHQRDWALAGGIDRVVWTFDPLVARNAAFNLGKLGARLVAYHPDFYGPLNDGINAGDETDRCVAVWNLLAPAAPARIDGSAVTVLARDGGAGPGNVTTRYDGARALRIEIPPDIIELRRRRADLAAAWRHALRATLPSALQAGFAVTGFSRDAAYLLSASGRC